MAAFLAFLEMLTNPPHFVAKFQAILENLVYCTTFFGANFLFALVFVLIVKAIVHAAAWLWSTRKSRDDDLELLSEDD